MAFVNVNGVRLFYKMSGTGKIPLVFVHGAWLSHSSWNLVTQSMAKSFRVLTYDRRGHSASERPTGQGYIQEDVADLAALMEHLDFTPAWVAGVSSGASITLRLAFERPDLFQGVIVHEPAFFEILTNDPQTAPLFNVVNGLFEKVVGQIESGDHIGAAEQFVETIAQGPGSWERMSADERQIFIENAPAFLDDINDPEHLNFDFEWLQGFTKPVLLTHGDQSPPPFAPIVAELANEMPHAKVLKFPGAGHRPHRTHPQVYISAITDFVNDYTL